MQYYITRVAAASDTHVCVCTHRIMTSHWDFSLKPVQVLVHFVTCPLMAMTLTSLVMMASSGERLAWRCCPLLLAAFSPYRRRSAGLTRAAGFDCLGILCPVDCTLYPYRTAPHDISYRDTPHRNLCNKHKKTTYYWSFQQTRAHCFPFASYVLCLNTDPELGRRQPSHSENFVKKLTDHCVGIWHLDWPRTSLLHCSYEPLGPLKHCIITYHYLLLTQ